MQLVRTLVWVFAAVIVALFAAANWFPVTVNLWGDVLMQTPLAFLIIIAFLLGLLPPLLIYRTRCWRLSRRLIHAERELADARSAPAVIPEENVGLIPGAPLLHVKSGTGL